MKYLIIISSICFLSFLTSCKTQVDPTGNAVLTDVAQTGSSMTLYSPSSSPSLVSTPTIIVHGVTSGQTVIVYKDSNCSQVIGSAVASGASVTITTAALTMGTYSFYTRSASKFGLSACSGSLLTYTYLGKMPVLGTGMSLVSPISSPGTISTPTLQVSGVSAGDTVSIYTNINCTALVGSAVATSSNVNITLSALVVGSYSFYTRSSNTLSTTTCSASLLSYTYSGVAPTLATSMALTHPVSSPGYISAPTVRLSGVVSGETISLYSNPTCTTILGSAVATTSTVSITTSALAVGTHYFYTKSTNSTGSTSCSGLLLSYNYLGPLPTTASSMSLRNPISSPGTVSTPTVRLFGVVSGETVGVYSNSACTNLVGAGIASGTTIDITTSALSVGSYNLYTKSMNGQGTSTCSASLLSYQYLGVAPTLASSMTLVNPASSPGHVGNPTIRLNGVVSGERVYLYRDSLCATSLGDATATSTTVNITSSLIPIGTSQFYTKTTNSAGSSSCSTALLTYQYLGAAPTVASSMTLVNPSTSPNYLSTPTVQLNGVVSGETVSLYSNDACSNLIGTTAAIGTTATIITNALPVGVTNFYTKSTNAYGSTTCSAALLSYNYAGTSPRIQVTWTANRETAVNKTGGGYKVYYSRTSGFGLSGVSYVDVPYVSGAAAPVTTTLSNLIKGTYYIKVVAYSSLNTPGGSGGTTSSASTEISINVP